MLTPEQLKQAVHAKKLTKTDTALLCLGAAGGKAAPLNQVRAAALNAGVKGAKSTNFSALLTSATGKAFLTPAGWELTEAGRAHVAKIAAVELVASPAAAQAQTLRALLPKLKNKAAKDFLAEAVVCSEQSLFRAAVVLSWVGAVALLYDQVVGSHLAPFNAEAGRRFKDWKSAKGADDLARIKEYEFLQILEAISVVGKNVKQELEACLKLRNACGHPSSFQIGPNKVAAHLESLGLNVYSVFA